MSRLQDLPPLIEAKSGASTIQCAPDSIRAQLGFDPGHMRRSGFDPSTIDLHGQFYERLESCMEHSLIGEYLTTLTPTESYQASGIWIATLQQIRDSVLGDGSLDSELFPHGYIGIAGDGSGNSVSFHSPSGRVIFAHHEHAEDIIAGDVPMLSEDIATFLDELLHDRLTKRFDELD